MNRSVSVKKKLMQWEPRNQAAFSLIELLVSLAISVLIMTATLQLFLNVTRTNDEMAKTNAQIENGRFTIQLLQGEISHAGFWGGYVPQYDDLTGSDTLGGTPGMVLGTPRESPDPCVWTDSDDYRDALLGVPVQVFDAALAGCNMPGLVDGTDVLVVRHAALSVVDDPATDCEATDPPCFQTTFCADEMPDYRLAAGTTTTLHTKDCATSTATLARQYVSNIYYIKDISGVPTLMLLEYGAASAQPLIEGIEGFKVELGIDNISKTGAAVDYTEIVDFGADDDRTNPLNRGDGVPDEFVRCPAGGCSVEQLRNVVAVKLYVLVRNQQETSGFEDDKKYCLESQQVDVGADCSADGLFQPDADEKKYKRHLFSSTIRLVNVSARRETP